MRRGAPLVRHTPLARGTKPLTRVALRRDKGLEHGTPSLKRTRLRSVNPRRRAKLRDAQFGPQAELCRKSPCAVCGRRGCDPHHEPPVSCGGLDKDTAPLCRLCHDLRHQLGPKRFEARTRVNLKAIVLEMRRRVGAEVKS